MDETVVVETPAPAFGPPSLAMGGRRRFATQQERDRFVAESFSDLDLTCVDQPEDRWRALPYERLRGQRLSQVWFVEDYLQLRFDRSGLTLNVLPALIPARGPAIRRSQPEYTARPVGLINSTVCAIDEALDLGLAVDFSSGTWIAGEPPWEGQPNQPTGRR